MIPLNVGFGLTWAAPLLDALAEAGMGDAVAVLLACDPATRVSLANPGDVAELLLALEKADAGDAVAVLAARAAAHASLGMPSGVAQLLGTLDKVGAGDAVAVLLAREPAAHVDLHDAGASQGC